MFPITTIKNVEFRLTSAKDVEQESIVHISHKKESKSNGLFDYRMGTVSDHYCTSCKKTQNQCIGHFGAFKFECAFYNPFFIKNISKILMGFCNNCSTPISPIPKKTRTRKHPSRILLMTCWPMPTITESVNGVI